MFEILGVLRRLVVTCFIKIIRIILKYKDYIIIITIIIITLINMRIINFIRIPKYKTSLDVYIESENRRKSTLTAMGDI